MKLHQAASRKCFTIKQNWRTAPANERKARITVASVCVFLLGLCNATKGIIRQRSSENKIPATVNSQIIFPQNCSLARDFVQFQKPTKADPFRVNPESLTTYLHPEDSLFWPWTNFLRCPFESMRNRSFQWGNVGVQFQTNSDHVFEMFHLV